MFEAGNILYGYFDLGSNGKKNKYAIVLHNDPLECIITTFTTSQPRSSVASPVHGRNPSQGEVMSYVFKSGVSIGVSPLSGEFFPLGKTLPLFRTMVLMRLQSAAFVLSSIIFGLYVNYTKKNTLT